MIIKKNKIKEIYFFINFVFVIILTLISMVCLSIAGEVRVPISDALQPITYGLIIFTIGILAAIFAIERGIVINKYLKSTKKG